jgi:hypothetical protein
VSEIMLVIVKHTSGRLVLSIPGACVAPLPAKPSETPPSCSLCLQRASHGTRKPRKRATLSSVGECKVYVIVPRVCPWNPLCMHERRNVWQIRKMDVLSLRGDL